ncbi:MAG: hypothetical protein K2Q01_12105 [Rickettsiales bacterium]|nr:hypothetical protein [Rickettsiales bacterium]
MQTTSTITDTRRLTERLSRAIGVPFTPGPEAATAQLLSSAHAELLAKRLDTLGVPATPASDRVSVDYAQLQQAIRNAGGNEDAFFDKLAEDAKNTTQENEQPVETRNDQPARERDQKQELKLAALVEGLQENKIAVEFRNSLLQRIELRERFEPEFDKAKALTEANKLIKAVNKSYDVAVQAAKKRNNVAAARIIERKPEPREPVQVALQEIERAQAELAAYNAEAMERSVKAFMRGNTGNLWQSAGAAYGVPALAPEMEIRLPQPKTPSRDTIELNGANMQNAISHMMEKLNLREPGMEPAMALGQLQPTPFFGRSPEQQLAV